MIVSYYPLKGVIFFLVGKQKSKRTVYRNICFQHDYLEFWFLLTALNLIYKSSLLLYMLFFSSFEQKCLDEQYFDAVDLVETAFNKLADNVVSVYL